MAARKVTSARSVAQSVDQFVAELSQPLKADVEALRRVILSTADGIAEGIKWNAPSFYTSEHFATMRLHGKVPLQLILHLGTKKRTFPPGAIEDPTKMLAWLGPDRACVSFARPGAVSTHAEALQTILRQWLPHIPIATG